MMDERNPENCMPYFPTEQDWSQAVRPSWIPMDKQFPGRFAVNNLLFYKTRQPDTGLQKLRGRSNAPPLQNAIRQGSRPAGKAKSLYLNSIPVDWASR
jgi:hypothetical protein